MPGSEETSRAVRPAAIVGRDAELAAVEAFLKSRQPGPAALVVMGEAGIGKTAIMRAALARAPVVGLQVLAAHPSATEADLPYAGLADLFDDAEPELLSELAPPQRDALASALAREGPRTVDRHALSRGVLELLRRATGRGPLLLVIDDVQWLDGPTSHALSFALRRVESLPLKVILAIRGADAQASEVTLGVGEWRSVRRIVVGPMSATEIGAVVRQQLETQLSRPALESLRDAVGGNPMFAVELVRRGYEPGAANAPRTLPEAVEERVRSLPEEPRRVLAVAAAALHPTTDLLARAGIGRPALRSATLTGLLVAEEQRLSFAHPLIGAAAYGLLLPDERRSVHAALAAASSDAVERGHHLARALTGHEESGADALTVAAREAAGLGDHASAGAFLLRAADLLETTDERRRGLQVDAAEQLHLSGAVQQAGDLASRLVAELPRGPLRARARIVRTYCLVGPDMTYDATMEELGAALADAEGDVAVEATVHMELAETAAGLFQLARSAAHLREGTRLGRIAKLPGVEVLAAASLGFVEFLLGRGAAESLRRAYESWDGSIDSISLYSPRMALAEVDLYAGAFAEAAHLYVDEAATAEAQGLEKIELIAHAHLAEVQIRAGDWTSALANARLAVEHATQAADQQIVTGSAYALGMIEALLGDLEAAHDRAAGALAAAEATGDFWHTNFERSVLGLIALSRGDPKEAVAVLTPAWSAITASELGELSVFPVPHILGEALAAIGRLDDAIAVAQRLRGSPGGSRPWSRAMAGRIEALVASARGEHATARDAIETALAAFAELPEPFEHARTMLIRGQVEGRARNWGAARAALVDALERFDQLGAARWAEKAAAEIARLPGRRPADKRALTERERAVAELAAAGLSNKEIVARLFLSRRTVETHLSKAYDKLGVRSRAELANRLGHGRG